MLLRADKPVLSRVAALISLIIKDNDYAQFLHNRIYFTVSYLNNRECQRIYNKYIKSHPHRLKK
ncbi:hypothetical protein AYY17_03340 [Morganella psychrotolerans]|uniref:Uncharacterized protein n=1 Tax=Morganella psychrotolerans TaxID=368603 RepID=A0A1B8HR50_9GAMM|nr:hypothetical protein AYY17_03340 [Morganella psychrotolerans]